LPKRNNFQKSGVVVRLFDVQLQGRRIPETVRPTALLQRCRPLKLAGNFPTAPQDIKRYTTKNATISVFHFKRRKCRKNRETAEKFR